jgi:hypothetical protein
MSNPEQQPNTSNLQTLENEIALTRQELDEFRKLPKEEQDKYRDEKLAKLKELQDKLNQAIQEAIRTGLLDKANKLKTQMEEEMVNMESLLDSDLEFLKTEFASFLQETFKNWYGDAESKVEQVPILINPKDQDYATLKDDIVPTKFGEYILNPDTQNLDFENIPESKIFIPDLSSFEGKPLHEVAKHLIDTYSNTHYIPGLEYWKWLIENPTKSPKKMQDGKYYFNFGSLVRDSDGHWSVPFALWIGSDWRRHANWSDSPWLSGYRVVLLEI